jgi:hypothetical protein
LIKGDGTRNVLVRVRTVRKERLVTLKSGEGIGFHHVELHGYAMFSPISIPSGGLASSFAVGAELTGPSTVDGVADGRALL